MRDSLELAVLNTRGQYSRLASLLDTATSPNSDQPLPFWYRHPTLSAYRTADSTCLLGCRFLDILAIIRRVLTLVNLSEFPPDSGWHSPRWIGLWTHDPLLLFRPTFNGSSDPFDARNLGFLSVLEVFRALPGKA